MQAIQGLHANLFGVLVVVPQPKGAATAQARSVDAFYDGCVSMCRKRGVKNKENVSHTCHKTFLKFNRSSTIS